ncbi:hypothetical protein Hsar01_03930 [Haloferula sargassicola]|uniref:Porin n=2 Tax=Haloferula sargassicola TaxID=490096 RepID=A0ABP9UZ70_9BACT
MACSFARECAAPAETSACPWLPPGTLYDNPDNPFIQKLSVFARVHYQYAWIDGESGGHDFWYSNHGEIRRVWPGLHASLANGVLAAHYEAMLEDDRHPSHGDRDLSYLANWALYLEWDLTKTFSLAGGNWWLGYGKRCLPLAEEVLDSSKFLPVVERTAISNRALITTTGGSAPLGAWIRHQAGPWETFAGLYTTDSAAYWGNWDDGTAVVVETQRDISDLTGTDAAVAALAFYHTDTEGRDERLSGDLNWLASAWAIVTEGPWTLRGNLLFGEADSSNPLRDGRVWGVVGTLERWLIQDRLELVGRYHYQGSRSPQGIAPYARYIGWAVAQENAPPAPSVRGDEQHGLYLGLNWLLCGHNLKLLTGAEWDHVSSDSTEVYDGLTYWMSMRMFF